ncbi:uncharacterized protein LOC143186684 [Calliopsis andreniformis]|uniref:uncharacterized protein LOC143186684 n=1 Tax=Calliopsis andreniformis TaxID=337506 RepID=UPI003FCD71B6
MDANIKDFTPPKMITATSTLSSPTTCYPDVREVNSCTDSTVCSYQRLTENMKERMMTPYGLLLMIAVCLGIFSIVQCEGICPSRCLCHLSQQPRSVMCVKQGLEVFPQNISTVVEQLNLSNNLLTNISSDINRLIELQYLNLARNILSSLPDDISSLKNLQKLDLSGNKIHEVADINSIRQLPSLTVLYVSRNPLPTLEGLISSSLEALDANHCEIREVSNTSLDGLPKLTTLRLVGNPLKYIQKAWGPKLRWLDMSDCLLNYLSPDTFSGFPELEELHLANNPTLVYSTRHSTLTHSKLKKLDVSKCNLDRPGLHGFPSLTHARLSRNTIRLLPDRIFAKNRELGFLYLNANNVENVNSSTFEGLINLQVLDLSANSLEEVHPLAFHENVQIKFINLSYNMLHEFPNLATTVATLDLSANIISDMSQKSLGGMQKIKSITLSDNQLEKLPFGLKSMTLRNFDLRRNRLVELKNDTLLYFPQLIRIDLSGNRLTELTDPSVFRNNPELNIVKLEDNPWHCDCKNLFVMFNFLTSSPGKTLETSLICQSPINVSGYSWESACFDEWNGPLYQNRDRTWSFVMICILTVIVLFGSFISIRHMMKVKRRVIEQRQQLESLRLLRQRRQQVVQEEPAERAPEPRIHPLELIGPPSYEEAVQMPRLTHSLDNLDEISVDASSVRVMGSADNLRTKQRRTRRLRKKIHSEDDLARREERRQGRNRRERNNSTGNIAGDLSLNASQKNSRSYTARRIARQRVVSECLDVGSDRVRPRPQTPSARKKRRRRTVYDGHSTDDEDSDFQSMNRSMIIRELRREPKSGYRVSTTEQES